MAKTLVGIHNQLYKQFQFFQNCYMFLLGDSWSTAKNNFNSVNYNEHYSSLLGTSIFQSFYIFN